MKKRLSMRKPADRQAIKARDEERAALEERRTVVEGQIEELAAQKCFRLRADASVHLSIESFKIKVPERDRFTLEAREAKRLTADGSLEYKMRDDLPAESVVPCNCGRWQDDVSP